MNRKEAYIALNLVPGIGPVTVKQLINAFGTPESIFEQSCTDLAQLPGIGPKKAEAITDPGIPTKLAEELELMTQVGAKAIIEHDADYPARLREVNDPPFVLYALGDTSILRRAGENGLAIIGTRMMSTYGEKMARTLSTSAARAGLVIVSGLAKGIDSVAHQAALDCDGMTVAVTGCGLMHTYPPENQGLMDDIARRGCLVSEQPMGMRPDRRTFPMRNRIVAGMCDGTLVVEAGTGSGSMITAERAMTYGRDVYAVPGRVDLPHSSGCHELIRRGAKLVESLDDIQNALTFLPGFDTVPAKDKCNAQTSLPPTNLSDDELLVVNELSSGEIELDALVARTGMPIHRLLSLLMQMELKRVIRQLPGKVFVLNN